ncbi:MAG: transcription elongation factor GreB [Alcaligenaceae bacterium]|nr:transcription elongation factor GreB [Alcaligenaceae bacterium]
MSKAFVKEDSSFEDDDFTAEGLAIPAGSKNYITRDGYNIMREELSLLVNKERPEMVSTVAWAASNGDRSENGDYIYGKKRLREIDRRIRFLTKRLETIEVVDTHLQTNRHQVFFGATVDYINQDNEEFKVTIVGIDEAEPLAGKISWISPVARALMKAKEGDVVYVNTPNGKQELEILEVSYPEH